MTCVTCEQGAWMQCVTFVNRERECNVTCMNRVNTMCYMWTGSVNAVCYVSTDEPIQSYTSTVVKNSPNPFWDEHFLLWVFLGFHPLSTYNYWESLSFYSNWGSPCCFISWKSLSFCSHGGSPCQFIYTESPCHVCWESCHFIHIKGVLVALYVESPCLLFTLSEPESLIFLFTLSEQVLVA